MPSKKILLLVVLFTIPAMAAGSTRFVKQHKTNSTHVISFSVLDTRELITQDIDSHLLLRITKDGAVGWDVEVVRKPYQQPDQTWVGQRIIMSRGWGEVHHAEHERARTVVGINIVTPVVRVEGNRVWVSSTGGDDNGWVYAKDVLLLSEAISYFSSAIERNPSDWDAFLRRAEAEHALNQRDAATADYTKAIELHPTEAFLYLRRGRHYSTVKDCQKELRDFKEAIRLAPNSTPQGYNLQAELFSLESGVYSSCPNPEYRDPGQAIATARRAVTLDRSRPTLLTILAVAYASAGDLPKAIRAQKQALSSRKFPPAYREDGEHQLQRYEEAHARQKTKSKELQLRPDQNVHARSPQFGHK